MINSLNFLIPHSQYAYDDAARKLWSWVKQLLFTAILLMKINDIIRQKSSRRICKNYNLKLAPLKHT